jgi:hypothetical protein
MKGEKTYFIVGIVLGVFLSAIFFFYFAPRYEAVKAGETMIKQDKWTGRSWRFTDEEWKPVVGVNRDWEKIDRALMAALRIPFADVDTDGALITLQDKHPVLADLRREEVLERIKLVYSKQVLVNMYLDSFLKTEAREQ